MKRALGFATAIVAACSGCANKDASSTSTQSSLDNAAAASEPKTLTANGNLRAGTLNREDLIEFAMAVRDYEPADQFSNQAFDDSPLFERRFHIQLNLSDPQNSELDKPFTYDAKRKVLAFSLFPTPVSIFMKTRSLGEEPRSNAFGATVNVKKTSTEAIEVGPERHSYDFDDTKKPIPIGVFPLNEEYDADLQQVKYSFSGLGKEIPMQPDAARRATQDLILVVDGYVTRTPESHTVTCIIDAHRATLDDPIEWFTRRCTISAHLTRISIVSRTDGELAFWSDKQGTPPRPHRTLYEAPDGALVDENGLPIAGQSNQPSR